MTLYYSNRLLDYIKCKIQDMDCNKVVWLGFSPGARCVYQRLLELGITNFSVFDNDKDKWGWEVTPIDGFWDEKIYVTGFEYDELDENTLFFTASNHYREFVDQLKQHGISENSTLDLNALMDGWTSEREKIILSNYQQIIGRDLQLEQLKILKWFRDFCEDKGLAWCLGEGTLLGAIRHEGFIPWDDDIDVFMPYEDYLRCIQVFPQGDDYFLLDWRTDERYPFQFAKVVEKGTYQIHPIPFGYFTLGCAIDIFPIAGYPADKEEVLKKYKRNKELDAKWDASLIQIDLYENGFSDCRQDITNEKYCIPFYEAEYVGTMQQIAGNAWAIPQKVFSETVMKKFEDDFFPVPIGYDEFLTARYGDYMVPPEESKRRIHSYPTYRMKN